MAIFGIEIEFSDKCPHLQDKHSCSWGSRGWWQSLGEIFLNFCNFTHVRPLHIPFTWPRGDNFACKYYFKLRSFAYLLVTHCQLSRKTTEIRLPYLRTLRLLREQTISQRHIFILSKPNDTNTATMRLHNHAVFSNKMNKNTLTGWVNCKKTTKFWQFGSQTSPNSNFFWKIGFIQIEGHV